MNDRYSRQELFAGIGVAGQQKIANSRVVIVGCGALGSLMSEVMCRAGVGSLTIVDRDFVEPSNLQRQSLFTENDAAQSLPKAIAAALHLRAINSQTEIESHVGDLNPSTLNLLGGADLILDGADNFQTRYLVNDHAWKSTTPWIYGACVGSTGVSAPFMPPDGPCLRCLFEEEPSPGSALTCDTAGIIWPAVGAVVSYAAAAALQLLSGTQPLAFMFSADVWNQHYHTVNIATSKKPGCLTCGVHAYPSLNNSGDLEVTMCGRDAVQIRPSRETRIDLQELRQKWEKVGTVNGNAFLLKLVAGKNEIVVFPDGRSLIKGTTDPAQARSLYSRYIGN